MSETLLAIDPGKRHAGFALFLDGALVQAGIAKIHIIDEPTPVYRHDLPIGDCRSSIWLADEIARHVGRADEVVTEFMHVFKTGHADPQDLFFCQQTAGAIAAKCGGRLRCVEAKTWKGQRSDSATWTMIRRALKAPEVATARSYGVYDDSGCYGKSFHHGLEAVGIGLWALWRI